MSSLRTKGKSTIVWILMGLLLLGLGGFGVTNFGGGDTDIGRVGQTRISGSDYQRALSRDLQQIAMETGRRPSMEEARVMGIVPAVRSRLVASAVLEEDARQKGVSVGDARVAQVIGEAPAFRGPGGRFDRAVYGDLLRRERLTEREFENDIRMDEARMILQSAVAGGVVAPVAQAGNMVGWILETRDISWMELTAAELPNPVAEPSEDTLRAWHQANADRFTAPEIRNISYVWLTPELLAERVELNEQALRELYDAAGDRYNLPERRMVSRLVFQSDAAAAEARARLDAGEITFEELAIERGLTLADTDLGEVTRDQLGAAGDAVFAATDNGIIGPVEINLGPALFSLNAIFDPVQISFEDALPDLRAEAAADRARRLIGDLAHDYEDLLAGGATLQQIADETEMEAGRIEWTAETPAQPGEISGYPSFREQAALVQSGDFLRLYELEDGGIFALQLDEVVAPALIPFEEVRDEVAADWIESETRRQLLELAEQRKLEAMADDLNGTAAPAEVAGEDSEGDETVAGDAAGEDIAADDVLTPPALPGATPPAAGEWATRERLGRDGYIEAAPQALIAEAFALAPGQVDIVDAEGRVLLVRVDAIHAAELDSEDALGLAQATRARLTEALQGDVFDYYIRALQAKYGVELNQSVMTGIESQM